MTIESPPYYGMFAFEYGIRYLNGETIPSRVMLPMRVYSVNNTSLLRKHLQLMAVHKRDFPLLEWGGQAELSVDCSEYYPKNWIEDPSLEKSPAFTTNPPIKIDQ